MPEKICRDPGYSLGHFREGACSQKNDAGHYEYHAYGVSPLALKVEATNRVVAPYATVLALSVDPRYLDKMEALAGPFGFFESADFQHPPRQRAAPAFVRCWMAHRQGMTLLAICNLLSDSFSACFTRK